MAFDKNQAQANGGAVSVTQSSVIFNGSSSIIFDDNVASQGGAIYGDETATIASDETAQVKFSNNMASTKLKVGGAISVIKSRIVFNGRSSIRFYNNWASEEEVYFKMNSTDSSKGGAVYGNSSKVICS